MSNITTWYDCQDLIKQVIWGSNSYIMNRIENVDDRLTYHKIMRVCEYIITDAPNAIEAMISLSKYSNDIDEKPISFIKRKFGRNKKRYAFMATDNAFDIVNKISIRFGVD